MPNPHMTPERLEELESAMEFERLSVSTTDELIAELRRCWGVIEKLRGTLRRIADEPLADPSDDLYPDYALETARKLAVSVLASTKESDNE